MCWATIVDLARAHGVAPLVAHNLERLHLGSVPQDACAALAAVRQRTAARAMLFAQELVRVLDALHEVGSPAMPLKGPMLAESVYGDATLRDCSDIDVLVPRDQVSNALDRLLRLGYQPDPEEKAAARLDPGLLLASNIEYRLVSPGSFPCALELHWGIAWRWPRARQATDDLWATARAARFRGARAQAPSPEWELIYLSVHAARHRWQGLKWLVDIHEVCSRERLDWDVLTQKAERFGWRDVLALTLGACDALLDTPIPPRVGVVTPPPWMRLFPASPVAPGRDDTLFAARLFRPLGRKLGYLARVCFVPTLAERGLVSLPRLVFGLYFVLRPIRLLGRWIVDQLRA